MDNRKHVGFTTSHELIDNLDDFIIGKSATRSRVISQMIEHCINDPSFKVKNRYSNEWAAVDQAVDNLGKGKVFEYKTIVDARKCEKHIRNKYPDIFISVRKSVGKAYKTRDALKTEAIYKVIVMERE
jgi:metal-responsive CopG/Arc/MetJ family transcriptional regulator